MNDSSGDDACAVIVVLFNLSSTSTEVPVLQDTAYVLSVLGFLYCVISDARFFYYGRRYERLRKRSSFYAMITSVGVIFQITSGTLFVAANYVCWINVSLSLLVVPFLGIPVPLRMLDHFTKYVFARGVLGLNAGGSDIEQNRMSVSIQVTKEDSWTKAARDAIFLLFKTAKLGVGSMKLETHPEEGTSPVRKPISMKSLFLLKFLTSSFARVSVCVACLLPFLIVIIIDLETIPYLYPSNQCYGCNPNDRESSVIFIGGAVIIALGVIGAIFVRKYPDPFGIVTECRLTTQYGGVLALIGFGLNLVYPDKILHGFSFSYVTFLAMMIIQFIVTDYQIYKAMKSELPHRSSQRAVGALAVSQTHEEGPVEAATIAKLKEYLDSKNAVFFEEYLVGEYSVELLRMYQDCHFYETRFFDMSESARRSRAKRIISTYATDGAVLEVNLPHQIKQALKEAAISPDSPPQFLFRDSQREVVEMLFGPWRRFIKTKVYLASQQQQQQSQ